MDNEKYTCPHCGKLRPVDPSTFKVGDVVYVTQTCMTSSRSANRTRISLRSAGYDGVIEDILSGDKAVVRRGLKGHGKQYTVALADLTPDDAPGVLTYVLLGQCQCNQQPTTDCNGKDTHNH